MSSAPNWPQLGYDVAHLAAILFVQLVFLFVVGLLAKRTFKNCASFLAHGAKGEATLVYGWFDIAIFILFCVFVYGQAASGSILQVTGLTKESSEPSLWSTNARLLMTTAIAIFSIVFVGVVSSKRPPED